MNLGVSAIHKQTQVPLIAFLQIHAKWGLRMTDLIGKVTDVNQTLAYGGQKMGKQFLRLGVLAVALGGILVLLGLDKPFDWMLAVACLALGIPLTIYGLVKWLAPPTPALVISPQGIRQYLDFVKTIDIPWHEVRGVDSIEISGKVGGDHHHLRNVTVVLVTRDFYNRRIHVGSWLMRGPAWHMLYIPKGDMVQVALHHEMVEASAAELREAVEWRWKAFRDVKPKTESVGGGWTRRRA